MPVKWRMARSLDKLLGQINAAYPNRSKASDGGIGDTAHSARASDHNPNGKGVVQARDFTHDPAKGLGGRALADALFASRDKRIKYIISDGQIASGYGSAHPFGVWRKYTGKNAHRKHVHISVRNEPEFYDDASPWTIPVPGVKVKATESDPLTVALNRGDTGRYVEDLQENLAALGYDTPKTGEFDAATERAVKAFQKEHGLKDDGIAGIRTNTAIGEALKAKETRPKLVAAKKVVTEAAAPGKTISTTEIAASVAGLGGFATAADSAKQSIDSAASLYETLISLGPWILLGLVILGAAAYIYYDRRKKRLEAREAAEVME